MQNVQQNNTQFVQRYIKGMEQVLQELKPCYEANFLHANAWFRLNDIARSLRAACREQDERFRLMRVAIVGAVKAGKSTFLNALLFGGKAVLPSAATPMTASLTRLFYSEKPTLTLQFYSREDWNDICAKAGEARRNVEEAVEKESKVMEAAKAARVVMTGSEEERAHKERMKQMEMDRKLRQEEMKRARKERERQREREEEMEEERREAEEERRREEAVRAEVKQIMAMQLNDSDPKQLTRELLELSAKIDAINIKDFFNSKTGAALRGKFRSGLIVLKTIDPHNPMIREMEAMQGKWRMKAAFPFILMGVAVVLMLILEKLGIID